MNQQFIINKTLANTTIKQGRNMIFDGNPHMKPNVSLAFKVACCCKDKPKQTKLFLDMLLSNNSRDHKKWTEVISSNKNYTDFLFELQFYRTMYSSKYVIKLKGITSTTNFGKDFSKFSTDEYPVFIFDKYDYDLLQWIEHRGTNSIKINSYRLKNIMRTLLMGLIEIHKKGIIHHDIKCSNILFMKHPQSVVYCDFGSAIHKNDANLNVMTYLCTICNRAPERFLELAFDERVDVYGLGCVFYFLVTGMPLFKCYTDNTKDAFDKCLNERKIVVARLNKTIPNTLFRNLLKKMLTFSGGERLFAHQCLDQRYFTKKRKRKPMLSFNKNVTKDHIKRTKKF